MTLEELHELGDQRRVQARLNFIHKQDIAVRYRVKNGSRQAEPDHRAEGFLTRIELDVTGRPAVGQHDERLNLSWLLVLALCIFLASLKDSLGLADVLGHLRI